MEHEPVKTDDTDVDPKRAAGNVKDPRAIGNAVVAPGLANENKPSQPAERLTAFQRLLQGDPAARSAVLGLSPIETNPPAVKAAESQQATPAEVSNYNVGNVGNMGNAAPVSQPESQPQAESQVDEPPASPPPLTTWMRSAGAGEGQPSGLAVPAASEAIAAPSSDAGERPVAEQAKTAADWIEAESVDGAAANIPVERLTSAPLEELLVLPAGQAAQAARAEKMAGGSDARSAETVRAMGQAEVERLARTIMIEGVSLQSIYESKQIDQTGLRAIVETYLRGGDIQKHLNYEIIEQQKRYERDPMNRKRSSGLDGVGGKISKASSIVAAKSIEYARLAQEAAGKAGKTIAKNAQQAQTKYAEGSDTQHWIGIGAAVVIWGIILILLFG